MRWRLYGSMVRTVNTYTYIVRYLLPTILAVCSSLGQMEHKKMLLAVYVTQNIYGQIEKFTLYDTIYTVEATTQKYVGQIGQYIL